MSSLMLGYVDAKHKQALRDYFDRAGERTEGAQPQLREVSFGEYLVEQGVLDRFQLFRALQLQDRIAVRVGEAAAALGYASTGTIERQHQQFSSLYTVTVE
jgi:hypothetical protein